MLELLGWRRQSKYLSSKKAQISELMEFLLLFCFCWLSMAGVQMANCRLLVSILVDCPAIAAVTIRSHNWPPITAADTSVTVTHSVSYPVQQTAKPRTEDEPLCQAKKASQLRRLSPWSAVHVRHMQFIVRMLCPATSGALESLVYGIRTSSIGLI